jgi:membrane protease YdiL (CAAX protease family)
MKQKTSPVQKILNLWAIILIVWAFYRAKLQMPAWFDEFIAKPLVFVLPVYYYIIKREKLNFFEGIGFYRKRIAKDFVIGTIIGLAIITTLILTLVLQNKKLSPPLSGQLLILAAISFAAAVSEEILSRGFVLKRLYQDSKNKFSASFLASILYFFLHIPILFTNPNLTQHILLLYMVIEIIFSFIISLIFLDYGLLIAILIHFFYSFALSTLI